MFEIFFFYLFAGLALLFGFLVVANPLSRNPVTSAMFLVLSIVALAGLFILLQAFFLAAVQVLVYAGAVIVLFLFVIMLLDLKEEEKARIHKIRGLCGLLAAAALASIFIGTFAGSAFAQRPGSVLSGSTASLGKLLFTDYLLPFEIVSLLLLAAMVGVILLSKKNLS